MQLESGFWRIRLVAYGARLESVLGASPQGFESPILRQVKPRQSKDIAVFCCRVHLQVHYEIRVIFMTAEIFHGSNAWGLCWAPRPAWHPRCLRALEALR